MCNTEKVAGGSVMGAFTEEMAFAKSSRVGACSASRMRLRFLPEETEAARGDGAGWERGGGGWGDTAKGFFQFYACP